MKTTYFINGKRISKKELTVKIGTERVKHYTEDAKEQFFEDPWVQNDYMISAREILTVEFK